MYYWGIQIGQKRTAFALIKKFQKNVKKHYRLKKIEEVQGQIQKDELVEKISHMYHSRQHVIRKRLFSQDRRPSKTALVHPGIIIGYHEEKGPDIVMALRRKKIITESIVIEKNGRAHREGQGRTGRDYHVPGQVLKDMIVKVAEQGRFIITPGIPIADNAIHDLPQQQFTSWGKEKASTGRVSDDIMFAVSIPVWFRETIRYSRAYSA